MKKALFAAAILAGISLLSSPTTEASVPSWLSASQETEKASQTINLNETKPVYKINGNEVHIEFKQNNTLQDILAVLKNYDATLEEIEGSGLNGTKYMRCEKFNFVVAFDENNLAFHFNTISGHVEDMKRGNIVLATIKRDGSSFDRKKKPFCDSIRFCDTSGNMTKRVKTEISDAHAILNITLLR